MTTGEAMTTQTPGPRCRTCGLTEARCAYRYGVCCDGCSHWLAYDLAGNERLSVSAGRRRLPVEHATERGYHQHRTRGELPCQPCRAAHSRYVNEHNERRAS
jgi:hypothetical protein